MSAEPRKVRVATVALAGCFGCHMSLLDIDERLITLLERVELDASPLNDFKQPGVVDVALIEGGVASDEDVHVVRRYRQRCRILVAVGACAISGGIPALRNSLDIRDCLATVYQATPGGIIPNDPELPTPLARVHPLHDVVPVDYALPGCPPSADAFWAFFSDILAGRPPRVEHGWLRYD